MESWRERNDVKNPTGSIDTFRLINSRLSLFFFFFPFLVFNNRRDQAWVVFLKSRWWMTWSRLGYSRVGKVDRWGGDELWSARERERESIDHRSPSVCRVEYSIMLIKTFIFSSCFSNFKLTYCKLFRWQWKSSWPALDCWLDTYKTDKRTVSWLTAQLIINLRPYSQKTNLKSQNVKFNPGTWNHHQKL